MINWYSVAANSFWIIGASVVLAAISYHYWQAGQSSRSLRKEFSRPPFQRVATFGLLLIGIGLAMTGNGLWQIVPAAALVLACLVALWALRGDGDHSTGSENNG